MLGVNDGRQSPQRKGRKGLKDGPVKMHGRLTSFPSTICSSVHNPYIGSILTQIACS